jgi:hypothetical protein
VAAEPCSGEPLIGRTTFHVHRTVEQVGAPRLPPVTTVKEKNYSVIHAGRQNLFKTIMIGRVFVVGEREWGHL